MNRSLGGDSLLSLRIDGRQQRRGCLRIPRRLTGDTLLLFHIRHLEQRWWSLGAEKRVKGERLRPFEGADSDQVEEVLDVVELRSQ